MVGHRVVMEHSKLVARADHRVLLMLEELLLLLAVAAEQAVVVVLVDLVAVVADLVDLEMLVDTHQLRGTTVVEPAMQVLVVVEVLRPLVMAVTVETA
jgi:hypothetical protein